MADSVECMIAVYRGEVRCAASMGGKCDWQSAVAEWSADRDVEEIVRVPVEVARMFLFKRWPGREQAIAEATVRVTTPGGPDA